MLNRKSETNGSMKAYLRTNRLLSERIRNYLPSVLLTNSSALVFPLVDTLIVGNLIGGEALAAVSLSAPIFVVSSIFTKILSAGLSKSLSIYLGKNDKDGINRCYQANRFILIFGFLFNLLSQIPIAALVISTYSFKTNDYGMVWAYFLGSMIGAPFDFVKSICVYNLRAFGKMKNLARLTIGIHLINLTGDIVLIRFCNLGVYGAGLATSISQVVFGIASFLLVRKHTDINKFEKTPWFGEMKKILQTGFPNALRVAYNAAQSWLLSCVVLYSLDLDGMAAKAACTSCYNILSIMFRSISDATQPLAGVLHGAEDKTGSRNLIRMALISSVSITLLLELLIEIFPATVLSMYGIKAPTAEQIAILRIFCSFIFLSAGINQIIDYFTCVRKSTWASVLTTLNGAPVFLPMLVLLSVTLGGVYIWFAYLFTALIAGTASVYYLSKYLRTELPAKKIDGNDFSLSILPEDGVEVSHLLFDHFNAVGADPKTANHMAVFLEEMTMYIRDNNPNAQIDITIREKESEFTILLFDNGKHRDYKFELENQELYDRLRVARLISSDVFYRNVLDLNYVSASFAKKSAA